MTSGCNVFDLIYSINIQITIKIKKNPPQADTITASAQSFHPLLGNRWNYLNEDSDSDRPTNYTIDLLRIMQVLELHR